MVLVDLGYSFPVGVRFHPTDEELLDHYLKLKTLESGSDSRVSAIPVVDICSWEPWDLPAIFNLHFSTISPDLSEIQANDHRWYFFCPRDSSSHTKRKTQLGYWKPTGTDTMIKSRRTGGTIGSKKTLVFYKGRAPNAQRTNWIIHEYQLNDTVLAASSHPPKAFVLCLLKNERGFNAIAEAQPSSVNGTAFNHITAPPNNTPPINHVASGAENQVAEDSPIIELSPEDQALIWQLINNEPTDANQQPQMHPEQGPSAMDFQHHIEYYCIESNDDDEEDEEEEEEEDKDNDWEPYVANPGDEYTWAERSLLFPVEFPEFLQDTTMESDDDDDYDNDDGDDISKCESYIVDPDDENTCEERFHHLRVECTVEESNPDEDPMEESSRHSIMAFRRIDMPESNVVGVPSVCTLTKEHVKDKASSIKTDTDILESQVAKIFPSIPHGFTKQIGMLQAGSSNSPWYRKENICFLDNEPKRYSGSSVDSIADKPPLEINSIEFTSPEFPDNNTRISRPQYQLRSHNSVAQKNAPRKIRMHEGLHKEANRGRVTESTSIMEKHEGRPDSAKATATATKVPEKESSNVRSKNDLGMAGVGNTKLSLKSREQKESSGRNQKGSINFVETPIASSHQSSPPHFSDVKDSESSSETEAEVVLQSQIDPLLETFRSLNINSRDSISQGKSSKSREYRRVNIGVLPNESGGSSDSSVDSNADKPSVMSFPQLSSPKFPTNNTRFRNSFAQRIASRKVCAKEVSPKPDSVKTRTTVAKLPQEENSIVMSKCDLGIAGGGSAKLNLKPRGQKESGGSS